MPAYPANQPVTAMPASPDEETSTLYKTINEEYKIWKKNSPFLYEMVVTRALEWPTLTAQWFPDMTVENGNSVHRLLIGTHTSDNAPNYLQIANVYLPAQTELDVSKYDGEKGEIGEYKDVKSRIEVTQSIAHAGEVNRARYMPQNPDLIATKAVSGEVFVFDRTRHANTPKNDECRPELTLRGHTQEGYGLSWNGSRKGHLLSGSDDGLICHWDLEAYAKGDRFLDPVATYRSHTSVVEDVEWHPSHESLFASVGDDRRLLLWDTRQSEHSAEGIAPIADIVAHDNDINVVSFAPFNENIFLTGSADTTVAMWDMRNLARPLHSFEGHKDAILQIEWSPTEETVFASASGDRRINIWDASRIGIEQPTQDSEDGPPELLFAHGGHTARPTEFSWNKNLPWTIASAAEDNLVQVWQPNSVLVTHEVDVPEDELE